MRVLKPCKKVLVRYLERPHRIVAIESCDVGNLRKVKKISRLPSI